MKNLITFLTLLICATSMFAQAPKSFNYQAVARNASGLPLPDKKVALRMSIRDVWSLGTIYYQERDTATTNQFGLFTIAIGSGTSLNDSSMNAVKWGINDKYLQVEIDTTGGTNYINMGAFQLQSVPYALYATSGGTTYTSGNGIVINGTIISADTTFSWKTKGNAGTNSSNFIGTTDNTSLSFRVNNQKAGTMDKLFDNTSFGYQSMNSNTTGSHNTADGEFALYSNTVGYENTAVGLAALYSNDSGAYNTAVGILALDSNTTGGNNVGIGYGALYSNKTGTANVGVGQNTGSNNVTGSGNVFIGNFAGFYETGSDKLYIANSSVGQPLIYGDFAAGNVGFGTITPTDKVDIFATGTYNNIEFENQPFEISTGNTTSDYSLYMGADKADSVSYIQSAHVGVQSSSLALNARGGNVGIGTSSPAARLDVENGATSPAFKLVDGTQGANKVLTSDASGNASWHAPKAPTVQTFTSGSATYTTPTNPAPLYIVVTVIGGGGGGGGNSGNGGNGNASTFGSLLTANGGTGGLSNSGGSAGGTVTVNVPAITKIAFPGSYGSSAVGTSAASVDPNGGTGGSSIFPGGGRGGYNDANNATAGTANTGGGGGGASNASVNGSGGGGAGGSIIAQINSPSTTYSVTVGSYGSAGTGSLTGGAGGSGVIIVEEYYQ